MKQQLNELVAKYNMMGRKADERFYHEFFRIAKESLDLDGYLTELVFIPKISKFGNNSFNFIIN